MPDVIEVADYRVALSHEHRKGIASDPATLWPDSDLRRQCGGESEVRGLVDTVVDSLYDRIARDDVLSRVFPHFETDAIKSFFREWLGVGRGYSGSPWPRQGVDRFHLQVHITKSLAAKWLRHMKGALHASQLPAASADAVLARLTPIAMSLVNAEDPPADEKQMVGSCHGVQTRAFLDRDAFRSAAAKGWTQVIRDALAADPPLAAMRGLDGRTLLWEAASRGRTAVIELLLGHGADLDIPGCQPATINLACSRSARIGTAVMVSPWSVAMARRHRAAADLLRAKGALVDVFSAAYVGDLQLLAACVDARPALLQAEDPAEDFRRITPLHNAIAGGQYDAAAWLIEQGHPVQPNSTWLLTHAALQNRVDLVQLLLDSGADARRAGVLGPLDAAQRPVAELLVSRGFDINDHPAYGAMLVRACRGDVSSRHTGRIGVLLSYGADVNRRPAGGLSALHYAARAGRLPVIKMLLDHGADVHCRDSQGLTPLGQVTKTRANADPLAVLQLLIEHGADVNSQSHRGESILFFFARRGDVRVVKWLLANGADPTVRNRAGQTPRQALRGDNSNLREVADLLADDA